MTAADLTPPVLALAAAAALLFILLLVVAGRSRASTQRADELARDVRQRADEAAHLRDQLAKAEAATREAHAARASVEQRFSAVVDIEQEIAAVRSKAAEEQAQAEAEVAHARERAARDLASIEAQGKAMQSNLAELQDLYAQKRKVYDGLLAQVAIFDERLAFAEMGVYEPHFDFDDSDQYKAAIERVRAQQKQKVSAKNAVVCQIEWTVDGSKAKGKTMSDRAVRLTLRAFNNECEAAIANVRWNNAKAIEKRIETARSQIDAMNASNQVVITHTYFQLKLEELRLTHEYREKQKAEKEERAEMARAAREEAKLQRDLEQAEAEESRYFKLLAKARKEAEGAVGPKLDAYAAQIEALERDLAEAHAKTERAQAMAEMTKTGYVYVISNVGSFGPDMVKIGLTRRLDPADRIRELGDASVPFLFDTHAVIYSDNAPALERALHVEFAAGRVNAKNLRKEFFRASISDVESAVRRLAPEASFFSDIEAQEYQETLAMRNAALATQANPALAFPASL
ncbi:DUF4041 domain-containing protein [Rubellimicrobium rubrum]|uniref:DUF4041 domain-containing protein n=1 Tax=Rubellimicrobium rubrum TaxID=2585369 RepID=A0A5C4MQC1_9RHOB|nr:DUF4041 domain-containing protein [Rubellimicrobium rubrum]TNC46256.1 DUF4041 domain-containing protein [Rubellimicrobium rubrum]